MQIKLFTMVKNEVDIVTDWTFYHGTIFGYNNLYIIDNNSNDGTFEQLIKFKSLGVNLVRKSDYSKKGEYMTHYYNKFCEPEDIGYPIDIDEFIVYYDKSSNKISTSRKKILNYLKSLPPAEIYKTNYIQATPNQDSPDGYRRAVAECKWGFYDGNYKENAKSFMKKKFYSGPIDHGNHIPTKNYYLTDLCLIHYHVRNREQIRKKIHSNVTGFSYDANNLAKLKELLKKNPECAGNHHVFQQIKVLENTHVLSCHHYTSESIDLTPINDCVKRIIV